MPKAYFTSTHNEIDRRLKNFVSFYGVDCSQYDDSKFIEKGACLFLNGSNENNEGYTDQFRDSLISKFSHIFIYDLAPKAHGMLQWITEGKISIVDGDKGETQLRIQEGDYELCGCLSGLSFCTSMNNSDYNFQINNIPTKNIITRGGRPFYVTFNLKKCRVFAVANSEIIDINQHIKRDFSLSSHISEFIPILMFLKMFFKERIWHSNKKFACFIIDDPVLKEKHGFLDFKKFIYLMDENKFCTNIGFIPFNWGKSQNNTANFFKEREDKYSISIHGCDHTKYEFGIKNEDELNRLAKLAIDRMKKHQLTTGIKFNKAMIFPQGIFVSNAMKILKANNFLGAINTDPFAVDIETLPLREFLLPAVTWYSDFLLLIRRYPVDIKEHALDLFIGKPILIVEHHSYLRDQGKRLCQIVNKLNLLSKDLEWKEPSYIMKHIYLNRFDDQGISRINLLCSHASIDVMDNKANQIIITKKENGNVPIKECIVNDKKINFKCNKGFFEAKLQIEKIGKIEFNINYVNDMKKSDKPGFVYNTKTRFRRILCDIRDNYIETNDNLAKQQMRIKRVTNKISHIRDRNKL